MNSFLFGSISAIMLLIINIILHRKIVSETTKRRMRTSEVELFLLPIYVLEVILFVAVFKTMIIKTPLDSSEAILKEFLHQNYATEISVDDISTLFNENDDEIDVLKLTINDIHNTDSKKISLDVRVGSWVYTDYNYQYIVGKNGLEHIKTSFS